MTSTITSWSVPLFDGWGGFRRGQTAEAAELLAKLLAEDDAAAARVHAAVVAAGRSLESDDRACVGGALWVPDPSTGDVYGGLVVELLDRRREGTSRLIDAEEYYDRLVNRRLPRGVKVFAREVEPIQVDAGPGVVVTESTGDRFFGKDVSTSVSWTVLPSDADHAIRLEFTTLLPAMVDELLEAAAEIARGLKVGLTPLPEAGTDA